jgi:hypothetical protein
VNIDELLDSPEWKQALKDALGFDPSKAKLPDNWKNPFMEALPKHDSFTDIQMGPVITEFKFYP